jgi:ubiquitin C-terminal hydrolase
LLGGDWHQDAQELLCCLFDSLEAEEDQRLQNEKPNFARANFYSAVSSTVTCLGCSLVPYRTTHTKRHAQHTPETDATNHWAQASVTEEATFPISVAIPAPQPDGAPATLKACIAAHTAPEEITYKCSGRARCPGPATRQLLIARPAPVLVVHLKRFSATLYAPSHDVAHNTQMLTTRTRARKRTTHAGLSARIMCSFRHF